MLYWEYQEYVSHLEEVYAEINRQKEKQQKAQGSNRQMGQMNRMMKSARRPSIPKGGRRR